MSVIIYCFQLPPEHGQCIHRQLVAQWLCSGDSGLGGGCALWVWRGAGWLMVAQLALQPAVLVAFALCQTGRWDQQCCAHREKLTVCLAVNQAARP